MTEETAAVERGMSATLRLLHELTGELQALESRVGTIERIREIVSALGQEPGLRPLPPLMLRVYAELMEALHGIRLSRATIESYSVDRLRDSHAKLREVTSTTESAALELLNGLDRAGHLIDRLAASGDGRDAATCAALRAELDALYGHLQFQDIIAQQLSGVSALLAGVEERMAALAALLDHEGASPAALPAAPREESSVTKAYNPDATMRDAAGRQERIDQVLRAARPDAAPGASAA